MDDPGTAKFCGRVPPQNIEAEIAVLGAIMLGERDTVEIASTVLSRDDFYRDAHGQIFDSMLHLAGKDEPVDIITLKDELGRRGHLDNIGGIGYLMELGEFVPTTANVLYHAQIVREKSVLRRLIVAATAIAADAYCESETPLCERLEAAESTIFAVTNAAQEKAAGVVVPLKTGLRSSQARVDERYHSGGKIRGLASGYFTLDQMLNGFQPGDLVIVAARPAVGKSAFAGNIGANVARRGGVVLVASLEMGADQWVDRLIVAEGRIDGGRFGRGDLTPEDWDAVMEATARLWDDTHFIVDTPRLTVAALKSHCRRIKPDVVVCDYLQLMAPADGAGRRQTTRAEEVAGIARDLKIMARELSLPVLALAQVNRLVERREDKRPGLSDLAESGGLEASADAVLFLHRPALYAADRGATDPVHDAECIVAKNRRGATGVVRLQFACNHARFYEQTAAPQ